MSLNIYFDPDYYTLVIDKILFWLLIYDKMVLSSDSSIFLKYVYPKLISKSKITAGLPIILNEPELVSYQH